MSKLTVTYADLSAAETAMKSALRAVTQAHAALMEGTDLDDSDFSTRGEKSATWHREARSSFNTAMSHAQTSFEALAQAFAEAESGYRTTDEVNAHNAAAKVN